MQTTPRAVIDNRQVARFAAFLSSADEVMPFDFCSAPDPGLFPTRGAPGVVAYFFFCCAHQFGFWLEQDGRYDRPMVARVEGVDYKGSDFLWRCATRAWSARPDFFEPGPRARLDEADWNRVFADDAGHNPLPMWREHWQIIQGYTAWFARAKTTPEALLKESSRAVRPLTAFLAGVGVIPGYAEDPLRKKLFLLAAILENRPEHFLPVSEGGAWEPIIDYHLMRSALRTGLVRVTDPALRSRLEQRERVTPDEEEAIRRAVFEAVKEVVRQSGRSVAAVDYFFFQNRRRCPEMTDPDCPVCPVRSMCAKETGLFQPVFRTTAY